MFLVISIIVPIAVIVIIILSVRNCIKKNKVNGISEAQKKKNRWFAALEIFLGFLICGFVAKPFSDEEEKKQVAIEQQELKKAEQEKQAILAGKFMVTSEVYNEIVNLFSSNGLGLIDDVTFNGSFPSENGKDTESIFIIKLKGREESQDNVVVSILNNEEVDSIILNSFTIFENGKLKNPIKEYYFNMNNSEKISWLREIKGYIRTQIIVPESLEMSFYPSEYVWGRDGITDIVVGSFKSQNAFGVILSQNFKAFIDRQNGTFSVKFM